MCTCLLGTRQDMEEISSRFSQESGSEEIFIPEYECEHPPAGDIGQQTFDDDMDNDDTYSPRAYQTKRPTLSATTTSKTPTNSATDILSLSTTSGN